MQMCKKKEIAPTAQFDWWILLKKEPKESYAKRPAGYRCHDQKNEKEKAMMGCVESDGSSWPVLPLIEAFVLVYLGI